MEDFTQAINEAIAAEVPEELDSAKEAQASTAGQELLDKENVVGVGVGHKWTKGEDTGEPAVVVLVTEKLQPELVPNADQNMVESEIDGMPTDVFAIGEIFAGDAFPSMNDEDAVYSTVDLDADIEQLRGRVRPVRPGYSVGHPRVTAGTIGAGCYDLKPFPGEPRRYYILSNNHVLAASNRASIGHPILQPGRADGGTYPQDVIGRLTRFQPIRFIKGSNAPCNYVDAAIAEVPFHVLDRDIYWSGYPRSIYQPARVGMYVKKTGRTTSFTTGRITVLNATVNVNYGSGNVGRFCRQIVTTDMSAGGDSGSLVLDFENKPVGLLFAGSSSATILNPIHYVQSALGVRVWP
jgi:hypothetical protein